MKKEIVVVAVSISIGRLFSRIPLPGRPSPDRLSAPSWRKRREPGCGRRAFGRRGNHSRKTCNDAFGIELRDSLENAGVKTGPVENVADSSGVALINTDAKGENAITVMAVPMASSRSNIDANVELLRRAGIVLTQLEIRWTRLASSELYSTGGIPLMLDPAPAKPSRRRSFPVWTG